MSGVTKILAGLGNPGGKYAQTRHNIGFSVVDAIASQYRINLNKSRFNSLYAKVRIYNYNTFLLKPQSYMNKSGFPIQQFAAYYKVEMEDVIIVHDDMDLAFGQIKIVKNRGHGGHNGVRSIIDVFGKKECVRVRIGVGHPNGQKNVVGHVLGGFTKEETSCLDRCVDTAKDACLSILEKNVTTAMNLCNTK